jgi:hypothetical protein
MISERSNTLYSVTAAAMLVLVGCSTTQQNSKISPTFSAGPIGQWATISAWTPERDPELRALLKARYDSAVKAYTMEESKLNEGKSMTEWVLRLADIVVAAEIDLAETPKDLIHALEVHLNAMKRFESQALRRMGGLAPSNEENLTRCWRLTAELDLLRAKRHFDAYHSR